MRGWRGRGEDRKALWTPRRRRHGSAARGGGGGDGVPGRPELAGRSINQVYQPVETRTHEPSARFLTSSARKPGKIASVTT